MCVCVSILSDGNGGGKVAQFIFGSDKTDSDTYFSVNPRYNCICGRIKWSAGYINTRTHTHTYRQAKGGSSYAKNSVKTSKHRKWLSPFSQRKERTQIGQLSEILRNEEKSDSKTNHKTSPSKGKTEDAAATGELFKNKCGNKNNSRIKLCRIWK